MLPTQETIDGLAVRIERAFRRRCAGWNWGCSTQRVWSAAAINLWRAHQEIPDLPLDPELFVASQPIQCMFPDPWGDLTQDESIRRYARRVRRIIRLLRVELAQEVALADRLLGRGIEIARVVSAKKSRISALGCYIVASRAGRGDLVAQLHDRALEQHRSCPLYRVACSVFLPDDFYPGSGARPSRELPSLAVSLGACDSSVN